jgi:O-antigen ligase
MLKFISKKEHLDLYILGFLFFLVGFSIPFSYIFNSISIGLLFVYSFYWFEKEIFLEFLKKKNISLSLFVIVFLLQLVGVLYSKNINTAFLNIEKSLVFLLIPLTFVNIHKYLTRKLVNLSLYGLISGVFLMLLSAHANILYKILSEKLSLESLLTYFTRVEFVKEAFVEIHPPYFGLLVVFILVPVTRLKLLKNVTLNKFLIYLLICYLIFSLYGISSFMSLSISLLFLLFSFISLLRRRKWRVIIILTTLLISLLLLIMPLFNKKVSDFGGGSMINRINWMFVKGKGDTSRPENWKSVLKVVKNNFLFGIGSDGGISQLQKYRYKYSEAFIYRHNAHNQYLEFLLRYGIVGLCLYLYILFLLVKKSILSEDKNFKWFLLVFILSSITESYLQRQIGITFFIFYAVLYSTFYNFEKLLNNAYEESTST